MSIDRASDRDPKLQKALATKRREAARLLRYPNVIAVGVGSKVVKGRVTKKVCIRVYVSKKLPPGRLGGDATIPTEIDGVPTDVIESDIPRASGMGGPPPGLQVFPILRGGIG